MGTMLRWLTAPTMPHMTKAFLNRNGGDGRQPRWKFSCEIQLQTIESTTLP
jgi:hypothetical protein